MLVDFSKISPCEERLPLFEDSEIACRVDKAKASVLSPKAKDCQRQLNDATSVWALDGRKFLFTFSETNEEGRQKVTVWGQKSPGDYQRIKTVWVSCHDYIFEAVALFLMEYFELFVLPTTYSSDADMLLDIQDKLKEAMRYTPTHLKQKIKLLKAWTEIMPRFNAMVAELDERIRDSVVTKVKVHEAIVSSGKSRGRMKAFFPTKGPAYYFNDIFSVAVRKECIEFYRKLKKGHALANVEVFSNFVRISVGCRGFADDLFATVTKEGIDVEKNPRLAELLDSECRYRILTERNGEETDTRLFVEIKRESQGWMEAIADPEIKKEILDMISFCLALYNELVKSPKESIKNLANHFYD